MKNPTLFEYLQKTKGLSRRDFMDMLKAGVVFVNEEKISDFANPINIGDDIKIILNTKDTYEEKVKRFPSGKKIIAVFNKPKGLVVSKDDKHNKTIFEILPPSWQKDMYYIGRLDKDSHGALLLTNDPSLVDYYESPENRILKIYEVKIDKPIKSRDTVKLKKGINVDDDGKLVNIEEPSGHYDNLKFHAITIVNMQDKGFFLRIVLTEGKKRHIRRALKALGYKTLDLKRIKVGKYELADIKPGKYRIYNV